MNRKFLCGRTNQSGGELYFDHHGWIYNQYFKEWCGIMRGDAPKSDGYTAKSGINDRNT